MSRADCRCEVCLCWHVVQKGHLCGSCKNGQHPGDPRPYVPKWPRKEKAA